MKLLLDAHASLWWCGPGGRLSGMARDAIADEANDVLVSAASAWEIATKYRLGKLPEAANIVGDIERTIAGQGFRELDISAIDGVYSGILLQYHGDPFDRILVAQALTRDLAPVSNETLFDRYGVRRLW